MYKWAVIGIFVLAFLLRIVSLGNLPAGFTPDEASFGYDANSLLKTGQDQWGNAFPSVFKSFGDYKLPVYTYITIPSVALFGLNEFAVRFPNALFGTLAVIATYFLVREFSDKRHTEDTTAVLAALFLALSPWHIALSRGAFEANLTTFFMTFGTYLFLHARRNQKLLTLAMFFFGINMFTYHSARLVTPVIVMSLLWIYRTDFPRRKVYSLASAVFLFFFITALLSLFTGAGTRAATSTILSQNLGSGNVRAAVVNSGMPQTIGKLVYNEPSFKLAKFVQNYASYYSPNFLFTEGSREVTYGMIPGTGVLTIVELIGLLFFGLLVIKRREKSFVFLIIWLVVAPIPAALSVGPGNAANRAAIMMPAIQIISAIGVVYGVSLLRVKYKTYAFPLIYSLSLILGLVSFGRYFYEQPSVANAGMMYGMKELYRFLQEYPTKHIIMSRSLSEPHMYAAFYDPINPQLYQAATRNWTFEEKGLAWVDQQEGYYVGRYTIGSIDKIRDFKFDNTFVVGKREEMPEDARIIKTILSPAKNELWVVAEKQ